MIAITFQPFPFSVGCRKLPAFPLFHLLCGVEIFSATDYTQLPPGWLQLSYNRQRLSYSATSRYSATHWPAATQLQRTATDSDSATRYSNQPIFSYPLAGCNSARTVSNPVLQLSYPVLQLAATVDSYPQPQLTPYCIYE